MAEIEIPQLVELLCCTADDPNVREFFELDDARLSKLKRDAKRDTVSFAGFPKRGIEANFSDGRIYEYSSEHLKNKLVLAAIFLYRKGIDRKSQYMGGLPFGIKFGQKQVDVVGLAGKPFAKGGGEVIHLLGPSLNWLRYDLGSCWMHLVFDADDNLQMVSLDGFCASCMLNATD
jgi:hypothetical protein